MSEQQVKPAKVRYFVENLPWFVRVFDINELARQEGISAQILKGRQKRRGTRTAFIITDGVEENIKLQDTLLSWLKQNLQKLRYDALNRRKPESEKESNEEVKTEVEELVVPLRFVRLPEARKRQNKGRRSPEGTTTTTTTKETKETKENKETKETKDNTTSTASSATPTPKTKRVRPPTTRVPRDDAVYLRLPGKTTVDELKELLKDFKDVDVRLNSLRGFRSRDKLISSEAIITVGAGNQEKAIEALKGKELHGKELEPFPSYKKVPVEAAN